MNKSVKFLTIISLLVLSIQGVSADSDWPLKFDALEYDFGEINEEDGIVSHTFIFANTSDQPVLIDNVSTSCGCTTASYPTEPIPPGQLCEFTVNFNPARTDGRVYRDIEVFVMGRKDCMGLVLMATVVPAPVGVKQMYPHAIAGSIRCMFNNSAFGYIAQGHTESKAFAIVNDSEKIVSVKATVTGNSGILTADCPAMLGPGESGSIILTYKLPSTPKYGTMADTLWIWADGVKGEFPITVNAILTDDFENQHGPQPKLGTDPSYCDFGVQKAGKILKQKFAIKNEGDADLIIRAVELSEGVTADLTAGTVIKPGASYGMTAATAVRGLSGHSYSGSVNLITNDPIRPRRELRLNVTTK